MTAKVRCMLLEEPERLVMREFDLPDTHDDTGLLQVEMAGICHTDVELYHGKVIRSYPLILGHEIVGRIARIGAAAARRWRVKEGDRVIVDSTVPCGHCRECISGSYKFCKERVSYGFSSAAQPPHLFGSYAEYLYLLPGAIMSRVPDDMSPELATLVSVPIANAIRWTVIKGGVRLGDAVVIQGVGPIGLSCVAVAKEVGADLVIATGLSSDEHRLRLALEFGADATIDVEAEDVVERVKDLTGGEMADVVVDVTGSGAAVRASLELVRVLGTVVNAGVTGDKTLSPLPLDTTLYKETRVQGVFSSDADAIRRGIRFASRRKYPFEKLLTHRFPLDQAELAVKTAGRETPDKTPIKVAIVSTTG